MAENTVAVDYANFLEVNTYTKTSTTLTTSVTTVVAQPLVSSTLMAVAFSVTAAASNSGNVFIGGYNVTSSVAGVILDAGQTYHFPATAFISDAGTFKYNLNRIYMAADASAQVCFINATVRRRDSNNPTA